MSNIHRTNWTSIKQIRTDNNLLTLYYVQDGAGYTIIEGDRNQIYWVVLHPIEDASDITDFETNFKSGATVVLSLDDAISKIFLGQDMNEDIVIALNNISGADPTQLVFSNKLYTVAATPNMVSAGEDNPIILIKNPSGSTKKLVLWKARFGIIVQNNYAHYKFWQNPTVTTNGTSKSIYSTNIGGSAPASQMEAYTLPTVSANGNLMSLWTLAENGNSVQTDIQGTISLHPGNSLLITGDPKANNRLAMCSLMWAEVS